MKTVFKSSRTARDGETRSSLDHNIQNTPAIDWNFQSGAPVLRGSGATFQRANVSFAGFRAIGNGFFEAEAKREYRMEAALFGVIVALALWPIAQAIQMLANTI